MNILGNDFERRFYNLVSSSNKKIKLCAPYVKSEIINNIYLRKNHGTKVDIISNFNIVNFYRKSSDLDAFMKIIKHKDRVFNNQRIHAKIYIFDDKYSIITSANLTNSGFKKNIEYGVFIEEENIVKETIKDFNLICENEITGKISSKNISNMEDIINNLPPFMDIAKSTFSIEDELNTKIKVDINNITKKLSTWKKNILTIMNDIEGFQFSLFDIYGKEETLKKLYPNNNTIKESIRRNLQELRDLGLVRFLGNGRYEKVI